MKKIKAPDWFIQEMAMSDTVSAPLIKEGGTDGVRFKMLPETKRKEIMRGVRFATAIREHAWSKWLYDMGIEGRYKYNRETKIIIKENIFKELAELFTGMAKKGLPDE